MTQSFFDQLMMRLDQRPELRPAARTRRDGRLAHLRHHGPVELRTRRDGHVGRARRPSCSTLVLGAARSGSAIIVAVIMGGVLGLALDAGLWRPLRRRGLGVVQLMIVSIGLSLALRYTYQYFIGGKTYQLPGASPAPIQFGPISLSYIDLDQHGRQHRRDPRASRTSCCAPASARPPARSPTTRSSPRPPASTSTASCGSSGSSPARSPRLSGILWAYFRPGVKWDMGTQMLLLIFAAITLGGLGTAFGALLGSLIVGLVVEVSTLWIPSDLKYAGALVVLILILLVRPQGLLGRKERLG